MSKQRCLKILAGVAILSLIVSRSAMSDDSVGRIRIGGFIGTGLSKQNDLNDTIDDMADIFHQYQEEDEFTFVDFDDEELGAGLVLGPYIEVLAGENVILGAEFVPLSSDGGYKWSFEYWDYDYYYSISARGDIDYQATAKLAAIYGIYLLPLSHTRVALRLGAGVGYLFGARFDYDESWRFEDSEWGEFETAEMNLEASGSATAFHGLFGLEYHISRNMLICANATYRAASVDQLEVDDIDSSYDSEFEYLKEGETLRWYNDGESCYFSTEEGDEVGLNFSGVYLTISLSYLF